MKLHQSPSNKKLQEALAERLINYGKEVKLKRSKADDTQLEKQSNSRNEKVKLSRTSNTFNEFYDGQINFMQRKYLKVQAEAIRKEQEEESIAKLRYLDILI